MTTPVGSIRFDATIDGSRLPDQALAAVERVMAPMTTKLLGKLEVIERQVNDLTRETQRETAKQSAAYDRVAESVEDIGDEHVKTAAKTQAASGMSTRSINAQTRALAKQSLAVEKLTADYQRLAAAQAASAAVPPPQRPTRGGGGGAGGGGGGGGGNHWSRGNTGSGGFFGFGGPVMGAVGWNAVAGIIGSFPAAATAVTNLTGAIQQLVQVGGVLPGLFAGGATSIGTAVLGFQGMADAVEALNEAAKSGDPKDLEKAAEALKDMDASAVAVAKSVSRFTQGPLKELQRNTAASMFPGVAEEIDALANKTMPTLMRGTAEVGSAWNKTFKELGRVGQLDSSQSFLDKIFGNTAEAQERANAAIEPLVHGLGTLTAEGTDFLPRIADALTSVTTRFDNWITKSANNGNLDKWIDQGLTAVGRMGDTILNVGKMITSLTQAAGGDGGLLKWLDEGSTKLADFMASAEGQEKLTAFFREGREQLAQWGPILQNVAGIVGDVYQASKEWSAVLLPFLRGATGLLSEMGPLVQVAFTGFLAWKTLGGFASLITSIGNVGSALDGVDRKLGDKGRGGILGKLGQLGSTRFLAGAGLGIGGALSQNTDGTQPISDIDALSTMGGFALAGSTFGPLGTALGLLAGAVTTTAQVLINESNRMAAIGEERKKFLDNRPPALPAASPNAPILPGPAVQPPTGIAAPNPAPGPVTVRGLLMGPEAGLGMGNGGDLRNLPAIDSALAGISDKAATARANIDLLATGVETLPTGEVVLKENTPEAIEKVKNLGYTIRDLPSGQVAINVQYMYNGRPISLDQLRAPIQVQAFPGDTTNPRLGGRADGGVLPGYSPGVDNLLVPMSGGEGVIIPEAMRALGGSWLYRLNSRFRPGISRSGYADGGVVGGAQLAGDPVLGLLGEIRDLLAGKAGGPVSDTATSIGAVADATQAGTRMGPFGTPIKARNPGYEMAAAAIQALGGDPEKFLGADPSTYLPASIRGGGAGALGMPGSGAGGFAGPLAEFARTGDLAGLVALGLDANDPVVKAIAAARNKKRNTLGGDAIAGLVEQVLAGGGYTGVLDSSNTGLVSALQTFAEKQAKGGTRRGGVTPTAVPVTFGGPAGDKQGLQPLASQLWDVIATQFPEVKTIGGVRSDPIPDHPSGRALDIMVGNNLELGDRINEFLRANAAPLGLDSTIWRDKWADFAGNSSTVGGHMDHIHAKVGTGPATGLAGLIPEGLSGLGVDASGNPLGYSGAPVPVYIVPGPGGGGMVPGVVGDMINAAADPLAGGARAGLNAILGVGDRPLPTNPVTPGMLAQERNPLAVAGMLGYQVQDYTRAGGGASAQNLLTPDGPGFDAGGRMFSDTASLLDRTFSSLEAANDARHQQLMDVLAQVRDQLGEKLLGPVLEDGVRAGVSTIADGATAAIGQSMGTAAAPPIADAVRSAVSGIAAAAAGGGGAGAPLGAAGQAAAQIFDEGGLWKSHTPAWNLSGQFERVLNPAETRLFDAGLLGGWNMQPQQQHQATTAGVNVNDTVGAEFFGVSQIPIIGTIVNVLIGILLRLVGIELEARDTLAEMTGEVRQFRGEFKGFDSVGRLVSDTSALIERSQTSESAVVDERVRILKTVISETIKWVIKQFVIPIVEAVSNTAIQAGAAAAGAAVNSQAPGAGGIVSSLISSAGTAAVGIGMDVWRAAVDAITPVATDVVGDLIETLFPGTTGGLFSGRWLEGLFGPLSRMLSGFAGGFSTLFGGLAATAFDDGGVALGKGLMYKDVIKPERVLSPSQTQSFEQLPDALRSLAKSTGGGDKHIYVTQQFFPATDTAARSSADNILELLGRG